MMSRKQTLLITATLLCALILSTTPTLAASGQEVKIPYVVSMSSSGWWTGIAITNGSGNPITDMVLAFTTDDGDPGALMLLENRREFQPPIDYYETELDDIPGNAILSGTLASLYAGKGLVPKTLPSEIGSVVLAHIGDEPFKVTVSIGSPNGFAYQVFESNSPSP